MAKPSLLYEPCKTCQGTRLAPPDHAIHESLPDQSTKLKRPHRAGRVPCPSCSGVGYVLSPITRDFLVDQAAELDAALAVLSDLIALLNDHEDDYLQDSRLFALAFRAEAILAADDEPAPETPARRAV